MTFILLGISLLLFVLSIGLCFIIESSNSLKQKICLFSLSLVFLFLCFSFGVAYYFTGTGFTDGITFHLFNGFKGISLTSFLPQIILILLGFLVLGGIFYFCIFVYSKTSKVKVFLFQFILIGIAILLHPTSHYLYSLLAEYRTPSTQNTVDINSFNTYYQAPSIKKTSSPKNLVFIYAESLERNFLDETLFPNLTPNLKELEQKSISFTNIIPINAGVTITGMIASQCGIPLMGASKYQESAMGGMERFLSGATCIGDLLKSAGYNLTYFGGANLSYAAKGNFYSSHGFDTIKGWQEFKPTLKDQNYKNTWGLHDDTLLDLTYQDFEQQSQSKIPFGLFLLTLDTHAPRGYRNKSCQEVQYLSGKNQYLNSIACADILITKFINRIRNSPYSKNTIIVLVSDHPAHRNHSTKTLNKKKRTNLFLINTHESYYEQNGLIVDIDGSTFDMGVTTLPFLGYTTRSIGLGRNLLQQGLESITSTISSNIENWRADILNFWEFPTITSEILIDPIKKEITIENQDFSFPLYVELFPSEQKFTSQIHFPSPYSNKDNLLLLIQNGDRTSRFFLIDTCQRTNLLSTKKISAPYCLFTPNIHEAIKNKTNITFNRLKSITEPPRNY